MKPWTNPGGALAPPPGLLWPDMATLSDVCCILDHALAERAASLGPLTERLGLSGTAIATLRDRFMPGTLLPDLHCPAPVVPAEQGAIRTLILWRAGTPPAEADWLASILARRALEPRHLWEDMGLPSRAALSGLIARHLPGLAAANNQNMRWKKFLYRQICVDGGLSLCLSPSCDACDERADCFAPE